MLVLAFALSACESNGSASNTGSDSAFDRSGVSSSYGSPSTNDE
jgi:hypothetical protein